MFLRDLDAMAVRTRLGLDDKFIPWLEDLESGGPPALPTSLPPVNEASGLFTHLGISPLDAVEILDSWPTPDQNPEIWWLLQRCHQQLVTQMGEPFLSWLRFWQPLPSFLGAIGRLFYVYVFLATLPRVRQYHKEHGITDEVSWATLADLGEHIAIHRRIFGTAGLASPGWLTLHFRGGIYRLGRLQFQPWRFPTQESDYYNVADNTIAESRPGPGDPALDIHIPESGGPLTPETCDESFALALDFFAHHFSKKLYRFGRCASWLLDPQLADYLPPTANIIRFQRRFHLVAGGGNGDRDVMLFVFRSFTSALDELPQQTTLERAVVKHLRAGQHWQFRDGWLTFQARTV